MKKIITLLLFVMSYDFAFSQTCVPGVVHSQPIYRSSQSNFTISGRRIMNADGAPIPGLGINFFDGIYLSNCHNVRIENCILGPSVRAGIWLQGCTNITIVNCAFLNNSSGVVSMGGSGIKVTGNQFLNAQGPKPRGQAVQFVEVTGANNEISNNVSEQVLGNSVPEDHINVYKSSGTASSYLLVKGNKLRGGGPSGSGGGIVLGDYGGNYQRAEDNILVDPGQYGIAIAAGHNIQLLNNKVYGRMQHFTNTGIYAYNVSAKEGTTCGSHTVAGNQINFTDSLGATTNGVFPGLPYENNMCGPIAGVETNQFNVPFGPELLPARLLCPLLMTHYSFNNNFNDISGGDLTATGVNTTFSSEGKGIGAVRFNGTSSYIKLPPSPWLLVNANRLTVSAWIKPATLQGTQTITSSQNADGFTDGWRLILVNGTLNGRITTTAGSVDVFSAGIQAGEWNHVTMTYDSKQLKLYVNGVLQSASAIAGNIVHGNYSANMLIGNGRGSNYFYNGQMDEFKFYIGDLTAAEVLLDYNTTKDAVNYPHALLAYYKFNNNWNDNSGNNLTLSPYHSNFVCDGEDALSAGFYGAGILTVPQSPILYPSTGKFYTSCWIRPSNVQGIKALAHSQNGDGYNQGWRMLLIDNMFNGRIVTSQGGADVYIGGIPADQWSHVGMSYDGSTLKGYLNGNLVTSIPFGGYLLTGVTANMRLGYSNGNNYYYFGLMDEFRFYDGNLSVQQILLDYQATKTAIEHQPPCPMMVTAPDITGKQPVSIKEATEIRVFPNPAGDELFIRSGERFSTTLFNIMGQAVLSGTGNAGQLRLDTRRLNTGTYLLQIVSEKGTTTRKVLINR